MAIIKNYMQWLNENFNEITEAGEAAGGNQKITAQELLQLFGRVTAETDAGTQKGPAAAEFLKRFVSQLTGMQLGQFAVLPSSPQIMVSTAGEVSGNNSLIYITAYVCATPNTTTLTQLVKQYNASAGAIQGNKLGNLSAEAQLGGSVQPAVPVTLYKVFSDIKPGNPAITADQFIQMVKSANPELIAAVAKGGRAALRGETLTAADENSLPELKKGLDELEAAVNKAAGTAGASSTSGNPVPGTTPAGTTVAPK